MIKAAYHDAIFQRTLRQKIRQLKSSKDNGIFYFLGNIHQHITHALPLHELVGGTVMVLSKIAADELKKKGIDALVIDDCPETFLDLDSKIANTIAYLNKNAKVVLLYETFTFKDIHIEPPTIMLSHGVPFKEYWVDWKIQTIIDNYTYIATVGPFMKKQLEQKGVPASQFIDIGLARNDLIINRTSYCTKKSFLHSLVGYLGQPIVCYMPTYWGATSVMDTGYEIVKNLSEDYYLIFKPHPQTPPEILEKYSDIISHRPNIHFPSESEVDILSLYKYSDVFIADMSSVIADIILAQKPLIFAYGDGDNMQNVDLYHPIREVYSTSFSVHAGQEDCVDFAVQAAQTRGRQLLTPAYQASSNNIFFNISGDARLGLLQFIFNNLDV